MNNHNHICMRKACVGLKAVQLVIVQKKRLEHHVNQSLFFLSRYNNHREEINVINKRTKTKEASCSCLPIDRRTDKLSTHQIVPRQLQPRLCSDKHDNSSCEEGKLRHESKH